MSENEIEEPAEVIDDQQMELAFIEDSGDDPLDPDAAEDPGNSPDAVEGADEAGEPVVSEWGSEEGLGS